MKKLYSTCLIFSLFFILLVSFNAAYGASYVPLKSSGNGLVVSSSKYANAIGQDVLDSGGNAFDAAVAVGYALSVAHPAAGNIAGGGFGLIYLNDSRLIERAQNLNGIKVAKSLDSIDSKDTSLPLNMTKTHNPSTNVNKKIHTDSKNLHNLDSIESKIKNKDALPSGLSHDKELQNLDSKTQNKDTSLLSMTGEMTQSMRTNTHNPPPNPPAKGGVKMIETTTKRGVIVASATKSEIMLESATKLDNTPIDSKKTISHISMDASKISSACPKNTTIYPSLCGGDYIDSKETQNLASKSPKNAMILALDFREVAPKNASKNMYLDSKNEIIGDSQTIGYRAIAVPGSVKGFSEILDKFGTKTLAELLEPSIKLAQNGIIVSERQSETMLEAQNDFKRFPPSRKYFLKPNGDVYREGEKLVQKDLARTLRIIARKGESAFYRGEIARAMASQIQQNGGILTLQDLNDYKVKWRSPISGTYRGYEVYSMPPPSSGGTHIIEILNTLEFADLGESGFHSSESIRIMAEAMRQAYADRAEFMGDSDFVKIPLTTLTSKEYAAKIYENITKSNTAIPSDSITAGLGMIESNLQNHNIESPDTTHFSVIDKWGNAISVTYTLNKRYGSAVALDGYGFLLNNQMENFTIKPGVPNRHGLIEGENNAIAPLKRPLSSMSPTIILRDGRLKMVLGSPGSGKIISTLVQVIVNMIDFKMNIVEAIDAPRFHTQWQPDALYVEKFLLNADTFKILSEKGYKIIESDYMGDVNAIIIEDSTIFGSLDSRRKL